MDVKDHFKIKNLKKKQRKQIYKNMVLIILANQKKLKKKRNKQI
jgi:hypothetical protein